MTGRPPLTVNGWMRWALIEPLLDDSIQSVLEVGVGQGALGFRLAERYRYVGLELDERALAVARSRLDGGRSSTAISTHSSRKIAST